MSDATFRSHRDNQRVLVEMWTVDALDGDHAAAALLSQLLWWFQPAKGTRQPRVRYEREAHLWLIRSDDDWYDDCRLTIKQVRRIRKALLERGLIVHRRFQINGAPTGAWRPDFEALEQYVAEYEAERPDGQLTTPSNAQMGESIRPVGQVPIDTHLSHTPKATPETALAVYGDVFERFWSAYPRKDERKRAFAAFAKAVHRVDPEVIVAKAIAYAADPNRLPQFTKQAPTWLNGDCWDDPLLPSRTGRPVASEVVNAAAAKVAARRDAGHGGLFALPKAN